MTSGAGIIPMQTDELVEKQKAAEFRFRRINSPAKTLFQR
jgi:hypothetical protein